MDISQTSAAPKQHGVSRQVRFAIKTGEVVDAVTNALLILLARMVSFCILILVRFVLRYRKTVIVKNLKTSFPLKSGTEIRALTNGYYRHLSDLVVEPFLFCMAPATLRRKLVSYANPELLDRHLKKGKSVIAFASHYGNWEYMINLPEVTKYPVHTAYTTIKNGPMNRLMIRLRSLFGVHLIPKEAFYRRGLSLLREPNLIVVIADQRPAPGNDKFHVTFLDQDTAVQTGGERMAAVSKAEVVFITCRKRAQFSYEYAFSQTPAAMATVPMSITKAYYEILEKHIAEAPAFWLWSHNRWKHPVNPGA